MVAFDDLLDTEKATHVLVYAANNDHLLIKDGKVLAISKVDLKQAMTDAADAAVKADNLAAAQVVANKEADINAIASREVNI